LGYVGVTPFYFWNYRWDSCFSICHLWS